MHYLFVFFIVLIKYISVMGHLSIGQLNISKYGLVKEEF